MCVVRCTYVTVHTGVCVCVLVSVITHTGACTRRVLSVDKEKKNVDRFLVWYLYKMEKTRGDKHAGLVLINDSQGLSEWSKRGFTEPKSYKNLFFLKEKEKMSETLMRWKRELKQRIFLIKY